MARTFSYTKNTNWGIISTITNDKLLPAFGNSFLRIQQTTSASAHPAKYTLKCEGYEFTLPHDYRVDFDINWIRYFAEKGKTKNITIEVYANTTLIASVEYVLYYGYAESLPTQTPIVVNKQDVIREDYFIPCPTWGTKHWHTAEILVVKEGVGIENDYGDYIEPEIGLYAFDLYSQSSVTIDNYYYEKYQPYNVKWIECDDLLELRITNRYGLRGAIAGKYRDVSEGGDADKTNSAIPRPYAGIYEWQKKGAKIKKEVAFNFEGDAEMLELLRDACIYGMCEFYDTKLNTWLPCKIEDNSIDNDAHKEQVVTIVLQEL
jgi:hypothetical protein